jgi:hypothetical protein
MWRPILFHYEQPFPSPALPAGPTKPDERGNSENICPSLQMLRIIRAWKGISSISSGKAKHGLIEVAGIVAKKRMTREDPRLLLRFMYLWNLR